MGMHNRYLILMSALFALVFVALLFSMFKHRRANAVSAAGFSGPTGSVQWLWALVPMAILGGVNLALFDVREDHDTVVAHKVELATAQHADTDRRAESANWVAAQAVRK